ncbi:MAG: Dabb family protein [Bacteroidales bacterium]
MIKHIVMFQLKELDTPEAKEAKLQEIKKGLEDLVGKVPTLISMVVGINCNPAEKYDLTLISEFESMEALEEYVVHPDHVAIGAVIRECLRARACVDYAF